MVKKTQDMTREEKIAHLKVRIKNYVGRRHIEFGQAREQVASGGERVFARDEDGYPIHDPISQALGDSVNGINLMTKTRGEYSSPGIELPKEMISEARRLMNRRSLIYSNVPGPIFKNRDYAVGRYDEVRRLHPDKIEAAKEPFYARCEALMEKKLAIYEKALEGLKEE